MDELIVLDNAQIVERGSHDVLLARGGIYATLWAHQSGGFLVTLDPSDENSELGIEH
jgi:ATP-binding cassette subfamily B multidrug efflux pump